MCGFSVFMVNSVLTRVVKATNASIAVLYFLVAGSIRYMTSGGDKAGTETAQKMITNALVGLLLLVASVPVVKFIGGYFGVPGEFFEINLDFITGPPEEEPQE